MRHGFSDDTSSGIEITAADLAAFANQDVARLAEMLYPQWRRNAQFAVEQALEAARFSLKSVDDATYETARPVLRAAKNFLADI
jgi:hypothetical protein